MDNTQKMTVTFFSNFLNAHQIPFCNQMYLHLGDGFKFVATEKMDAERLNMKFEDVTHKYPYAVNSWELDEQMREAERLGRESDVVIIGDAPMRFVEERLRANKLTFRYTERYFKRGRWRILDPRVAWHHYKNDFRWRNRPYHLLCASAYTAPDCRFIGCFKDKAYRWGYFPEVREYDESQLMDAKPYQKMTILWVARMIAWKRPNQVIEMAAKLRDKGYKFNLIMIGEGPERGRIEELVKDYRLTETVTIKDFMPQDEVRHQMELANIFIFTSNQQEGWGAVLNEAMNSGCAVVANDRIGSVPFLIEGGVNGLSYHDTIEDLTDKVETLLKHPSLVRAMGISSYRAMRTTWNATTAATRLLELSSALLSQRPIPIYQDGPCSKC